MAPLPKPPGHRIERGAKNATGWRTLPPAEPFPRPTLPTRKPTWLKSTREWWGVLWASPMATTYLAADVPALLRLAEMVELRARGKLGATETVAMTALEDRFGLNPKSRRALQWEVSIAEKADQRASDVDAPRLRVVDDA